jgi:hypothetical protein
MKNADSYRLDRVLAGTVPGEGCPLFMFMLFPPEVTALAWHGEKA